MYAIFVLICALLFTKRIEAAWGWFHRFKNLCAHTDSFFI